MPAAKTISKGVSEAQFKAFEEARKRAGLTESQAKDEMLHLFCAHHGVDWPPTEQHGGLRYRRCPVCQGKGTIHPQGDSDFYDCWKCHGYGEIRADED